MKRSSATRASSVCSSNYSGSAEDIGGTERPVAEIKTGYLHLLKNHGADEMIRLLEKEPDLYEMGKAFLHYGSIPVHLNDPSAFFFCEMTTQGMLLEWFLFIREPDLFLGCLALAETPWLTVTKKEAARTLIEVVQSSEFPAEIEFRIEPLRDRRSGFKLSPEFQREDKFDFEMLDLLKTALKLGDLNKISLDVENKFLSPLLPILARIKNLELRLSYAEGNLARLVWVTTLVQQNLQIKSLWIVLTKGVNLLGERDFGMPEQDDVRTLAVLLLLDGLAAQQQLQELILYDIPDAGQEALSKLIAKSKTLTRLEIYLKPGAIREPLLAALEENTVIQTLIFEKEDIGDSFLPLLDLFKQNKSSVTDLMLNTPCFLQKPDTAMELQIVCEMIRSNRTLSSFCWDSIYAEKLDLFSLGLALQQNRTLESIRLTLPDLIDIAESLDSDIKNVQTWRLPDFVECLAKNRSLTSFVVTADPLVEEFDQYQDAFLHIPEVQAILARNRSYRDISCSRNFIAAAADSFFSPFGMPVEMTNMIAENLLQERPRIRAGALALVNKTVYGAASAARRNEFVNASGATHAAENTRYME